MTRITYTALVATIGMTWFTFSGAGNASNAIDEMQADQVASTIKTVTESARVLAFMAKARGETLIEINGMQIALNEFGQISQQDICKSIGAAEGALTCDKGTIRLPEAKTFGACVSYDEQTGAAKRGHLTATLRCDIYR